MTTTFDTRVNGIPCQCRVVDYSSEVPSVFRFGMWHPPEPQVFDYEILDRRGRKAPWLERYLDDDVSMRLLSEFIEGKQDYFTEPDYGD